MTNGGLTLPDAKTKACELIRDRGEIILQLAPVGADTKSFLPLVMIEANDPRLAACDPVSVLKSATNLSVLGLMPGAALGHAYFVSLKIKGRAMCQLWIGYKGWIDLAIASRYLSDVHAEVIVDGEDFELTNTANGPQLRHNLTDRMLGKTDEPTRDNIVGAYCVYHTQPGGRGVVPVTRKAIDKVDKYLATKRKDIPWWTHYDAMCKKTAILRSKNEWRTTRAMTLAAELEAHIESDTEQPDFSGGKVLDVQSDALSLREFDEKEVSPDEATAPAEEHQNEE